MGPTSLVSVTGRGIVKDLAVIDLFETMIHLWLLNGSEAVGHFGWLDNSRLRIRSRSRHFRWLMVHIHCCLVNLVVRQCKVFLEVKFLQEPIFVANIVIFDVPCPHA